MTVLANPRYARPAVRGGTDTVEIVPSKPLVQIGIGPRERRGFLN